MSTNLKPNASVRPVRGFCDVRSSESSTEIKAGKWT